MFDQSQREAAEDDRQHDRYEAECDYCGQTGHTFRSCPKRDDVVDYPTES